MKRKARHARSGALNGTKKKAAGAGLGRENGKGKNTAIHLPDDVWRLLRAVAFKRAQTRSARVSVSRVLVGLVEERRTELEKEAGPYYQK